MIHGGALMLVLALTLSNGVVERLAPQRAMVLLTPLPVNPSALSAAPHAVPRAPQRMVSSAHRLFHAPASASASPEPLQIAAMQIPMLDEVRPLLPPVEFSRLPVASPPPLRTDSLASFMEPTPAAYVPASLHSSGFDQPAGEALSRVRKTRISRAEFADETIMPSVNKRSVLVAAATPVTRSVEILSKPRPAYTEEARLLRLEGEVLLNVLFAASGQVRVLGTVRGLGHGLDENAIAAAESIQFRPAERSGIAADSIALVHIVFQLAF